MRDPARHSTSFFRVRPRWTAIPALVLSLSSICGCRNTSTRFDKEPDRLPQDPSYKGSKLIDFHRATIRLCPRPAPSNVTHRLSSTSREDLSRLESGSCLRLSAFLRPDRAVIRLDEKLTQQQRMELVLRDGPGYGALVVRSKKQFWWAEPAHLADAIEGCMPKSRQEATVRILDNKKDEGFSSPTLPAQRLETAVEYRFGDEEARHSCQMQILFTVWHASHKSLPTKPGSMLINFALLPLGGPWGARVLEQIRSMIGFPIRWTVSARCRHWPGERRSVVLIAELIPSALGNLLEDAKLKARRAALPPKGFTRRFGPVHGLSRQDVPPAAMRRLRSAAISPEQERSGKLRIRNLTERFLFIAIDGFRVGRVAPSSTFQFQHIPPGYYRVSAHSPLGLRSWGPRDLHLSGTWTIR